MENSESPVTKADFQRLQTAMLEWKEELRNEMHELEHRLEDRMIAHREFTVRYFDTLLENLAADARGGARDEFQMLKDRQSDHTVRICRLEAHIGGVS